MRERYQPVPDTYDAGKTTTRYCREDLDDWDVHVDERAQAPPASPMEVHSPRAFPIEMHSPPILRPVEAIVIDLVTLAIVIDLETPVVTPPRDAVTPVVTPAITPAVFPVFGSGPYEGRCLEAEFRDFHVGEPSTPALHVQAEVMDGVAAQREQPPLDSSSEESAGEEQLSEESNEFSPDESTPKRFRRVSSVYKVGAHFRRRRAHKKALI